MAAQLGVVYSSRAIGGAFVIHDARPAALRLSRVLTWVLARQSLTDVLLAVRNAGSRLCPRTRRMRVNSWTSLKSGTFTRFERDGLDFLSRGCGNACKQYQRCDEEFSREMHVVIPISEYRSLSS